MKTTFLLASLALPLAALAGCLNGVDPTDQLPGGIGGPIPQDWFQYVIPDDPDHDHKNTKEHQDLSTPNFEILGWDPLVSDYLGHTAGGTLCGDAVDSGDRRLAVVHSYTTDVSFFLIDVTDATKPTLIGEFVTPWTESRDVALSIDGKHVIIATAGPQQPADSPDPDVPLLQARASWRGLCTGGEWVPVAERLGVAPASQDDKAYPPGFLMVNVEDPANIVVESSVVAPVLGGHSVTVSDVNGESLVIGSTTNLAGPAVYWHIMHILDTPAGSQLEVLSVYDDPPGPGTGAPINGHNDGWAQVHPITGQTLAYLAAWHQGAIILDITDPRLPQKIGQWTDAKDAEVNPQGDLVDDNLVQDGPGNIHEVIPLEGTWDGKHYVFIGQEILAHPSNSPSGWARVLDTTDPTLPKLVAQWTLPLDIDWGGGGGGLFSTHYVTVHDKTLYMAHYHAGVWAIDLSNLGKEELLPAIGAFVPANDPPNPPPEHDAYTWTPTIMEVDALDNGDLVVFDSWSGAYVVRFDPTNPAPPAYPFTDY